MTSNAIALPREKHYIGIFECLPLVALLIDLFTPLPIWRNVLPASVRWGSQAAIVLIIAVCITRMLAFNRIPLSFWAAIAICLLWSYVALGNGQGIASTVWGVWLLVQFPFVALFMYLQPSLPRDLSKHVRSFSLAILGLQVLVQLLQFAGGARPGDSMSGLFGENGTGNSALFAILVACLFFGYWIESGRWRGLALALSFGTISSVLGEMKLFPLAITAIGLVAAVLYAVRHRSPVRTLIVVFVISAVLVGFGYLYNLLVPGAETDPIQSYITNVSELSQYLDRVDTQNVGGSIYTDMGRNFAVQLGWDSIRKDPITLIFGYGIGSRSESKTLGSAGLALSNEDFGWSVGTSLLVFMQETGLLGLALLSAFLVWVALSMVRDIRKFPRSPALGMRYAILLFSELWPVWLYYAVSWTMRVPMLLYWLSVGYVFAESWRSTMGQDPQASLG